MPIIKSAKKRVKTTQKASVRNAKTKKGLRASLRNFHASLTGGKKVDETQRKAQSEIDKAVKKGVMSKNKAARKKRQLNTKAKAVSGSKKTTSAPAAKKPVAKAKSPAKKAPAKKTTKK
jgi:small subunit ribosomal protein S20